MMLKICGQVGAMIQRYATAGQGTVLCLDKETENNNERRSGCSSFLQMWTLVILDIFES